MSTPMHSHDPSASVSVTAEVKDLDEFCRAVWELQGNDEKTYWNFVIGGHNFDRDNYCFPLGDQEKNPRETTDIQDITE